MEIEKITLNYNDGSYAEYHYKKADQDYCHREDGPAYISYDKDDLIKCESYYINNKRHREGGPARIGYNKDGSIRYEEYWINGKYLSKKDWERDYGWKSKLKGTPMEEIFLTSN